MNKGILLAILATVLIAGCTGGQLPVIPWITSPTTFAGGSGLVISDFSIDNTQVYSNHSAKITMTVDNKGGSTVPQAKALTVLQGSAIKDTLADNLYWSGRSTTTSVYQNMGKDMKPYDPVKDVPADEKTLDWYLTSPTGITAGTTRNDVFIGRLYYDYATTVTGNVWVYSQAESDAAKASGRSLNQNSFTSTSGPIAVYVTVKPSNVVVSTGDNTFTVQIKVSNVGGGTVYLQGAVDYVAHTLAIDANTQLNRVVIAVTSPAGWSGFDACNSPAEGTELVKGEATLSCDVTTIVPSTFQSDQLSVVANYGYWVERTASVTVSGK